MKKRRLSRPVSIGNVTIGGGSPIAVQSMTKTDTRDVPATVRQIAELEEAGCELIRVAVPDMEAAEALPSIKKAIHIPLIADIHFDYRLALSAIKGGVDGLRLNPGNIGAKERVVAVVNAAKERQIPIRIGVNAGSLPKSVESMEGSTPEKMVAVALEQVRLLESLDFELIKVSLKAFDVPTTIQAYRLIADKISYPLHLGITEAGPPPAGLVRSAVGLGILLYEGIGDTLRVSLTGPPTEEVAAGYEILKCLELRQHGPVLVSCPSCGRSEAYGFVGLARKVEAYLAKLDKPIKVAVMGCVVNGPGEAREADIGIACGKGRGTLFRKGKPVRTVEEGEYLEALVGEIDRLSGG
ncbi:MAG: flavodoxin-dependent (E)-4-hydroxy-3-methylbut-2-enyl-diphosphate synthase [Dehalococcoidia bacterium]|nr:flavodoxin-dependent (E)-4-hydroxy-3-methylbut-2-enyl-diphosphate synthase [Dehalococcoidia bacterium]